MKKSINNKANIKETRMVNLPSGAIQVENGISLVQKKLWYELVYDAFPNMKNQRVFTIKIQDLMDKIGWEGSHNDKTLKAALKGLIEKPLDWNILGRDNKRVWESFSMLAGCNIPENSGVCNYDFSAFLQARFLEMGTIFYTKIDLMMSHKFQSKYPLAIYSLALDYLILEKNMGEKVISIEDLRKYLGIKDDEYKLFGNFNKRILKASEKEINKLSDMNIKITPEKDIGSKKINKIRLQMTLNPERIKFYLSSKSAEKKEVEMTLEETNMFNLLEAPRNKNEEKKELIKVENLELKKFFAEHKTAINTDTVQNKLKEIIEMFHDKFEDYLLFLMSYVKQESNKKAITSLSGFYIGLLKDDSQLDNYVFYLQKQRENEQNKNHKVKALVENELNKRYEKYLLLDFEKYLENNMDKLESKMIELIESNLKRDDFLYEVVIMKFHNGKIDKTLITASKPSVKPSIVGYLKSYKDELGYKTISFDEWKKQLTEKYLQELESEIEKNLSR